MTSLRQNFASLKIFQNNIYLLTGLFLIHICHILSLRYSLNNICSKKKRWCSALVYFTSLWFCCKFAGAVGFVKSEASKKIIISESLCLFVVVKFVCDAGRYRFSKWSDTFRNYVVFVFAIRNKGNLLHISEVFNLRWNLIDYKLNRDVKYFLLLNWQMKFLTCQYKVRSRNTSCL